MALSTGYSRVAPRPSLIPHELQGRKSCTHGHCISFNHPREEKVYVTYLKAGVIAVGFGDCFRDALKLDIFRWTALYRSSWLHLISFPMIFPDLTARRILAPRMGSKCDQSFGSPLPEAAYIGKLVTLKRRIDAVHVYFMSSAKHGHRRRDLQRQKSLNLDRNSSDLNLQ